MIIETIVNVIFGLFKLVIDWLPDIPEFPSAVTDAILVFDQYTAEATNFVSFLLGEPLYYAALSLTIFFILFDIAVKIGVRIVLFTLLRRVFS